MTSAALRVFTALSLCPLLLGTTHAQEASGSSQKGVPVHVTDLKGTPLWKANVYVREILPQAGDPMRYIGETDRGGMISIPADAFARDVLVFDFGFVPWVGFVRGTPSSKQVLAVRMRQAPCTSPDTECHDDWDVFGPPKRKRR